MRISEEQFKLSREQATKVSVLSRRIGRLLMEGCKVSHPEVQRLIKERARLLADYLDKKLARDK